MGVHGGKFWVKSVLKRSVLHFKASKSWSSKEINAKKGCCIDNRLPGNGGANSLSKLKHQLENFLL